jgi:hypothetical protein
MSPNAGGGGDFRLAGSQPMRTAVHRPNKLWNSYSFFNLCDRVLRWGEGEGPGLNIIV